MALPTWTGIALAVTRMILAILVLSLILPRRERFGRRMGAVLTLCVVTCAVCIWCCYFVWPALSTTYQPLSQLVAFTLLILVFIPLLQSSPFDKSNAAAHRHSPLPIPRSRP